MEKEGEMREERGMRDKEEEEGGRVPEHARRMGGKKRRKRTQQREIKRTYFPDREGPVRETTEAGDQALCFSLPFYHSLSSSLSK